MEELITLILKSYGIIGLIMCSPFVAVVFLWKNVIALHKELYKVHEMRINDAKAVSEKLMMIVQEQSSLNKETNLILERVGESLSYLAKR